MQPPKLLSEPESIKREIAFFLVDYTDGKEAETEETGVAQIRKPGEITWTNTENYILHIGFGHYIIILTQTELDTLGLVSIRYKSEETVEFQDTFQVTTESDGISLEKIYAKLNLMDYRLRRIEFWVKRTDKQIKPDPFQSPF